MQQPDQSSNESTNLTFDFATFPTSSSESDQLEREQQEFLFQYELYGLTQQDNDGYSTEDFNEDAGEKLVSHLPPMSNFQTTSNGQHHQINFWCQRCNCRTGETCRWERTSTHCYLFKRQIENLRPARVGLHLWETWRLSNNEKHIWDDFVSSKRRSNSFGLWHNTGQFLGFSNAEVDYCCQYDKLWFEFGRNRFSDGWLFLAELRKDKTVRVLLFRETEAHVHKTIEVTDPVYWCPQGYTIHNRLVEYQFALYKTVQAETAIHLFTSQLFKDYTYDSTLPAFEDICDASSRGLLRLLQ